MVWALLVPVIAAFLILLIIYHHVQSFWPMKYRIFAVGYERDRLGRYFDLKCRRCGFMWRTTLACMVYESCPVCEQNEGRERILSSLADLNKNADPSPK